MQKYFFFFPLFLVSFFLLTEVDITFAQECPTTGFTAVDGVCLPTGTGLSGGPGGATSGADIESVLINVAKWLLGIVGVLAVLIFAICGVKYLVAAGEDKMLQSAKTCMTWSIVGVAVAISGLIIVTAVDALLKADTEYF